MPYPSDREKFDFEKQAKGRELAAKEADNARLTEELLFKKTEAKWRRWINPLFVAIIGAVIVGGFNIYVTLINADRQRDAAEKATTFQSNAAQILAVHEAQTELKKAESASILEIVKMADPDKVHNALCLLIGLNTIKTTETNAYIESYANAHKPCETSVVGIGAVEDAHDRTSASGSLSGSEWKTASMEIPGCGISGCFKSHLVCGPVPADEHATGKVRNFGDSFSGAWGEWGEPATIKDGKDGKDGSVCRIFIQHSHNVARRASFEYEIAPGPSKQ